MSLLATGERWPQLRRAPTIVGEWEAYGRTPLGDRHSSLTLIRQYVAIAAGGGSGIFGRGDEIVVHALPVER